jgi:hypothetical protein
VTGGREPGQEPADRIVEVQRPPVAEGKCRDRDDRLAHRGDPEAAGEIHRPAGFSVGMAGDDGPGDPTAPADQHHRADDLARPDGRFDHAVRRARPTGADFTGHGNHQAWTSSTTLPDQRETMPGRTPPRPRSGHLAGVSRLFPAHGHTV